MDVLPLAAHDLGMADRSILTLDAPLDEAREVALLRRVAELEQERDALLELLAKAYADRRRERHDNRETKR